MTSTAPPWVRDLTRADLWLRRLRTVGLGCLLLFDAVYSSAGFDGRRRAEHGVFVGMSQPSSGLGMTVAVLGFALMVAVMWRRRWPVAYTVAGCVAVLLALGPTAALIGLMSVLVTRPMKDVYRLAPFVAAATLLAVWRDLRSTPRQVSFWQTFVAQDGAQPDWYMVLIVTAALLVLYGGVGMWLRTRAQLRTVTVVADQEREAVTSLTDQVSRQAERERLAREIHDGLGHNLSILSVHAGALQAMADASAAEADGQGPATAQMKESAQVVRETAAKSVAELHSLLDLLRSKDDPDVAAPTKTLRDVRALIDDSVMAGMPLVATVFVDDSAGLDPHIAQAAYRIVQELLTNARKHASTVSVRLSLTGGPDEGHLVIATANHLPPPTGPRATNAASGNAGTEQRSGMGLTGIRERVEHYGGDMEAGVGPDAVFRVAIRLPWVTPGQDAPRQTRRDERTRGVDLTKGNG